MSENVVGTAFRYEIPPWVTGTPAICAAMAAIKRGLVAVAKEKRNEQQNYAFRGIDDVYNALHPLFAEHGVTTPPTVLSRDATERATKSGGVMLHVVLSVEFRFMASDGSALVVGPVYAEALDTSDKATNKCMSFAHKYAMVQTFGIPTADVAEGDRQTIELGDAVAAYAPTPERIDAMISSYAAIGIDENTLQESVGVPLKQVTAQQFAWLADNFKKARDAAKPKRKRSVDDIVEERQQ